MRTLLKLVVLAHMAIVAIPSVAQTSSELHTRYGEPDQERFIVRPAISVSAQYGPDQLVCRFEMQPISQHKVKKQQSSLSPNDTGPSSGETLEVHTELNDPPPMLQADESDAVLEELVPSSSRGFELSQFTIETGGNRIQIIEYRNVSISRSLQYLGKNKPERLLQITATFKRDECN